MKLGVMRELLAKKFEPSTELGEKLKKTKKVKLVEGNTWNDTFWGVCRGKGENWLGRLLMERREELLKKP